MKLSFSLSSKPSSKPPLNSKSSQTFNANDQNLSTETTAKEFVTEFDASKTLTLAQRSNKLVIPPKPNEWRPHKKMKNLDLPLQPSQPPDLRFEIEKPSAAADGGPNISYGLNLRNSETEEAKKFELDERLPRPPPVEAVMLQKLKEDLKSLPEDRGFDEFSDMPVEGFGAALLAGYGWYEGRGIGRNAKEDVKVVEYKKRTAKEGLGFVNVMPTHKENSGREEEAMRFRVGTDVRVIGGRDFGLKGRVVEVVGGGDSVVVKLSRTGEEARVKIRDIAELGSVEEESCLKKLKELKIRESKESKHGSGGSDGRRHKDSKWSREQGGRTREETRASSRVVSWLTSHIRVRVISKELKGGRLYLKKGEVVDVVGPSTCDISMDESRELVQGVDQELLETALPRRGGAVLVLCGKHKGVYGSLVERDMENETGVVRDADTHALFNVRLEQIAEYMGDPSYIGY